MGCVRREEVMERPGRCPRSRCVTAEHSLGSSFSILSRGRYRGRRRRLAILRSCTKRSVEVRPRAMVRCLSRDQSHWVLEGPAGEWTGGAIWVVSLVSVWLTSETIDCASRAGHTANLSS